MKPGLAGLTAMRCIVLLNITEPVAGAVAHFRIRNTAATVAAGIVTALCDGKADFHTYLNTDSDSGTQQGCIGYSPVQLPGFSRIEYGDGFFFQLKLFNGFLFHV
jgi:hypothetical protein